MARAVRSAVVMVLALVVLTGLAVLTHVVAALAPYGVALLLQDRMTPEAMLAVAVIVYLAGVAVTAAVLARLVGRLRGQSLRRALLWGVAAFSVISTIGLAVALAAPEAIERVGSTAFPYLTQPYALLMGLVTLVLWLTEVRRHASRDGGSTLCDPRQEGSVSFTTSSSDPERYPSRSCVT